MKGYLLPRLRHPLNMKRNILIGLVGVLIALTMLTVRHIHGLDNQIKFKQIQLKDNSAQLKLLDSKYDVLNKELDKSGADKAKIEQQLQDLQKERDSLNAQLQAKTDAKNKTLAQATLGAVGATVSAAPANCGSDPNMAFIYQHESGCNTASINSIGCAGIGQACPGSKLPCPLNNFACQDNYFKIYAVARYGSTYAAMLAWKAQGWW